MEGPGAGVKANVADMLLTFTEELRAHSQD